MNASSVAPTATSRVTGSDYETPGGSAPAYAPGSLHVPADVTYPSQINVVKRYLVAYPNAVCRAALTPDIIGTGVVRLSPVSSGR
jgi:hypothetical protein